MSKLWINTDAGRWYITGDDAVEHLFPETEDPDRRMDKEKQLEAEMEEVREQIKKMIERSSVVRLEE